MGTWEKVINERIHNHIVLWDVIIIFPFNRIPRPYMFLTLYTQQFPYLSLHWRHNERNGVSNHQPRDFLLNHLFRHRPNKTSKLRVTGLCEENSPVTSEFPTQRASCAEHVSIWWRHHVIWRIRIPCSPLYHCFTFRDWRSWQENPCDWLAAFVKRQLGNRSPFHSYGFMAIEAWVRN